MPRKTVLAMKHTFRFLGQPNNEETWSIDAADQIHIKRVLKLKPGEAIEVGDGCGRWA